MWLFLVLQSGTELLPSTDLSEIRHDKVSVRKMLSTLILGTFLIQAATPSIPHPVFIRAKCSSFYSVRVYVVWTRLMLFSCFCYRARGAWTPGTRAAGGGREGVPGASAQARGAGTQAACSSAGDRGARTPSRGGEKGPHRGESQGTN